MKHKVLVDLSWADTQVSHLPLTGIPQDLRLLFGGFMESQKLDLSGLIYGFYGCHEDTFGFKGDELEEVAIFLGPYLNHLPIDVGRGFTQKVFRKLFPQLSNYVNRYLIKEKSEFDLKSINLDHFGDLLWRKFFSITLSAEDREMLFSKQLKFFWSGFSIERLNRSPISVLKTSEFDFVLFQNPRMVKLAPNTQKIIRYHDGLPVFATDTVLNEYLTLTHIRVLRQCTEDSIFVCDSTSSVDELSKISAKAADNAYVIPCFVPTMGKKQVTSDILKSICCRRYSQSTQPKDKEIDIQKWFIADKIPKFIMSLATIEPRKNYIGLIEAWLKLRYETGEDIKLMIVGKPGWGFEKTVSAMRPFVASGDLMHLEGVAQIELPYLYSSASCFVFPSFCEGFGMPPNEAMQCDCPVAVSDIPAHRYSAGNAALFFNPYDINDISQKVRLLLDRDKNYLLINDLIEKGRNNVSRFSKKALLPQWEDLFDQLKQKEKQYV